MNRRLLLICQNHHAPAQQLVDLVTASSEFTWIRMPWSADSPARIPAQTADAIVAATADPVFEALDFLTWLTKLPRDAPTFVLTHADCGEEVLEAASAVSDDFLTGLASKAEFRQRVLRLVQSRRNIEEIADRLIADIGSAELIGESEAFVRVVQMLPRLAASELPVLIMGETGTGKDVCARVIHQLSRRRGQPFIAADCSVIPPHLFENEMFGHVRGAYTDASQEQRGLITLANGGTLFLDEIDALSPAAQSKFLRFLQERTYRPLGSERIMEADVNIIAATNADLEKAINEQSFRADLFFRLNVLEVRLPPLRERACDIAALAKHFLELHPNVALRGKRLSTAAVRKLASHDWPGNVRELCNVVQRAAVLCDGSIILPQHLSVGRTSIEKPITTGSFREERTRAIEFFERNFVAELLSQNHGNVTRAARAAGKDRRAFGRLMKKYGINRQAL